MADDFGSYLRHERELRGVSLDEIASVTKIHVRYLQALESNAFDQLPGEVFIKGFIRSYAKAIGSNVDELLVAYDETVGRERQEIRQKTRTESEEETQKQVFLVNALVGGFLLLFLVFAIWFLTRTPPPKPGPQTMPAPAARAPEAPAQPETADADGENPQPPAAALPQLPGEEPTQEKFVPEGQNGGIIQPLQDQQVKEDTATSAPGPVSRDGLELVIRVTENSWFNLSADNSREQDFILPAGASKTFRAQTGFRLTIGNRRGTQLALNGRDLSLPPTPDNVVREFKITADTIE